MNKSIMKQIIEEYRFIDILKSLGTACIFFGLLLSIFLIPVIDIMYLYIPYMEFFLIGIYIYVSLMSIYFNKRFVQTLQSYKIVESIDYEKFKIRSTTAMTVLAFIIVFVIYLLLH